MQSFGLYFAVFAFSNMIIVATVAVASYLKICRRINIDWKFLTFVLVSSFALSIPATLTVGPSRYWCFTRNDGYSLYFALFSVFLDFGLFGVVAISFLKVYLFMKTKSVTKNVATPNKITVIEASMVSEVKFETNDQVAKRDIVDMEHKAIKKIMSYIFNYLIQCIPVIPSVLFPLFGYNEDWM
jgi:hypothetical protein